MKVSSLPSGKPSSSEVSFFGFWPNWLMYLPVVFQWLWHSLKSRSFTVSLLANPAIPLGGMAGVPRSAILSAAEPELQKLILPWCVFRRTDGRAGEQVPAIMKLMEKHDLKFPVVFKPDCGCGAGVKKIGSQGEVLSYLLRFPAGEDIFIQQLAHHEHEAGIFYVRDPRENHGKVVSLTLKKIPSVTGDGQAKLRELIARDSRASSKTGLYHDRMRHLWEEVIPEGQKVPLIFSASHQQGAVFRDVRKLITPELQVSVDRLMQHLPQFYYGCLDVKFADLEALQAGEDLQLFEINGASAELIHLWDSRTAPGDIIRSLLWQYRSLFELGLWQRSQGFKPPGWWALYKAWRRKKALARHFQVTD